MTIFRKTSHADAAPGERHCRACGGSLADDQLACLQCGAVDVAAGGRERRWLLPTSGLVGIGLLLVTSASFAATTALSTGDPTAVKQQPPAVAQAAPPANLPPASGDGTAPKPYTGKAPDLGSAPPAPAAPAAPATPATPSSGSGGSKSNGSSGGSGSNSSGGSSGNSGSGSNNGSGSDTPAKPPAPKIPTWPTGEEGYTVLVPGYAFAKKADAKAKAREVAAKGLPAGILHSDDYASLDPGSWVVYIGKFDSAKKADKESRKYEHAGYPGDVTFVGNTPSPEYQPPPDGTTTTPQQP